MSAITTATIVGIAAAGASAGATVYAAKKGASAAKDAAAQQTASANAALDTQKESYQQQRQDFNPWQQAGAGALGNLQAMSQGPRNTFNPNASLAAMGNPYGSQPGQAPSIANAQRGMGGSAQMGGNPGQAPPGGQIAQQGMPPPQPQQAQGGPLWTVQGPDGSTKQLPPEIAQQFIQRGARRVA